MKAHKCLYVTLNENSEIIHFSIAKKGNEEFVEFMKSDFMKILNSGKFCNYIMIEYNIPDNVTFHLSCDDIIYDHKKFQSKLADDGIKIARSITMKDMLYCLAHDIDPLLPSGHHDCLVTHKDYNNDISISNKKIYEKIFFTNAPFDTILPSPAETLLSKYGCGNFYFSALETRKGILLFSHTPQGHNHYNNYLRALGENYFRPEFDYGNVITEYILKAWPSLLQGKFDLTDSVDNIINDNSEIPDSAYLDKSILKYKIYEKKFSLAPTIYDYMELINGFSIIGCCDYNFDYVQLRSIQENGYSLEGYHGDFPYYFVYTEPFEDIDEKLRQKISPEEEVKIQLEAKKIATDLIQKNYSHLGRYKTSLVEQYLESETIQLPPPSKVRHKL